VQNLLPKGIGFKRIETELPGVCVIQPTVFSDMRGFFLETYQQAKFAEIGITDVFVQDNHSCSAHGVLRGLHYQLKHPQAKLCRVVEGKVLDVAIDIRMGSPHFGKWTSVVLSAEDQNQIYISRGFAHGFLVLSNTAQVLYKCSDFYDPSDERGVIWNDPDLNIVWDIMAPLVSNKDKQHPRLADIRQQSLPQYWVS
jgi:dTDP-4-dehydrorhamnose 3,5-epimerase